MAECAPGCPRSGAAVPIHHPRLEHLRMYGWRLFAEASAVNQRGHRIEGSSCPTWPARRRASCRSSSRLACSPVGAGTDRVGRRNAFFAAYRSGDAYDTDAITHVMRCTSHLPGDFIQDDDSG
jgi:hypothetical protein